MITISRLLARRLKTVLTRGLRITASGPQPTIVFAADQDHLSIFARGPETAIAYAAPDAAPDSPFAVPFELLKRCAGTKDQPLTLQRCDNEVLAEWTDAGVPQVVRFPVEDAEEPPPLPNLLQPNEPELLAALRDASETTDADSTRYALGCLRLRGGNQGQIAASDSRQLLVQEGFLFPWVGDVLVPACRAFACADLWTGEPIGVGRTDEWLTLRSGPWTLWLRIEQEARFPDVDRHIPPESGSTCTLHLSDADADFLARAIGRLPGSEEPSSPVTVDLNGEVLIRAKASDQPVPTELALTGSRCEGGPVVFQSQRSLLARAVQLGFRRFQISGPETPVCGRDQRRQFVWAPLGPAGTIAADPDAVRIESSAAPTPQTASQRRSPTAMSKPKQNGQPRSRTAETKRPATPSVIAQAEALRDVLTQALTQTRGLIGALKQRKKQSRLVRTTLASLRQLDEADV